MVPDPLLRPLLVADAEAPPRFTFRLEGACNRCGLCCLVRLADGRELRCEHLRLVGRPGSPEASYCAVYERRWDGMPIALLDRATGQRVDTGAQATRCAKGSLGELLMILGRGIGRGCSLVPVEREEPAWAALMPRELGGEADAADPEG